MNRLRLPLFGKILAWFALNLAVLALLFSPSVLHWLTHDSSASPRKRGPDTR